MTMKSMIRSDDDDDVHALDLHRLRDVQRHPLQADQVRKAVPTHLRPRGHKLQEHRHRVLPAAVLVGHNPRHHPIRLACCHRQPHCYRHRGHASPPSPPSTLSSSLPHHHCCRHLFDTDFVIASLIASHATTDATNATKSSLSRVTNTTLTNTTLNTTSLSRVTNTTLNNNNNITHQQHPAFMRRTVQICCPTVVHRSCKAT